ncbi:MAG: UvrD-helicase domain-containing protein [Pedobacter sp.]|nr:UvrD-helicase domain-containing protein [Pedobacter sp.]MDQ8054488.1 UvrD-helicase domain-containing protein [Pedobacter sp.]
MNRPLKILQASAGSGKTFSLAAHYLTLLFSGPNKYREILAVTFTNKATEEMKSRILEVLAGLAKGDSAQKIDDYRKLILIAHPDLTATELQLRADQIYRKILHDYSRFSVSTIDGFVQRVIRGFAFELGLDSGYSLEMNTEKVKQELAQRLEKLLDEKENILHWIIELALDRISNNKSWNYKSELLALISEVFKDRFKDFEAAIRAFGTQNVDEVFKRYIAFSKNFIKNYEDALMALAETASGHIVSSGLSTDDLKGKTRSKLLRFKSIAQGSLKEIESVLTLLDDEGNWLQKGRNNILFAAINPILREMQQIYGQGNEQYVLAKAFLKNGYYLRLMQEVAGLLVQYREESEKLLISDAQQLLNGIAEDAGDNPSFIWEKMGNQYRNFLFDEFQDTSRNQWNSFKALVGNAIATHDGKLTSHLIVGDTKQSIYRWRDGDYRLLHSDAKIDLLPHNVIDDKLWENYRSTKAIIDFNNGLYEQLAKLLQTQINQEIPADHSALQEFWHGQQRQYDQIITNIYEGVAQRTHANTADGGMVKVKKIIFEKPKKADDDDFANTLITDFNDAENVKEASLREMLVEIELLLTEKGYQQREIGILVRSNSDATAVVNALMNDGLDVISGEALKIASSAAIKLIINALKLLITTQEQSALYKANCIALYAQIHGKSINGEHYFELKRTPIESLTHVFPSDFCENHRTWLQLPVAALIEKLISAFGLDTYQKDSINPFLPYLLAFRDLVNSAMLLGEKGITAFLTWWEEDGKSKNLPSPETANAIQVLTIHKSKGLAFRAVFIPFCDWRLGGKVNSTFWVPMEGTPYEELQRVPLQYTSSLKSSSVASHYVEELLFNYLDALNTLYVATTRAKDYLYIAVPAKKSKSITNIGDAILQVYEEDFGEFGTEIEFGAYGTQNDRAMQLSPLALTTYPTSDRLAEIYESTEDRPLQYIDNITKSGQKGSALHAILAEANSIAELDQVIEKQILAGLITESEKQAYTEQVQAVLEHPELSALLKSGAQHINERSIIGRDGKTYRPDKLIINKDEVIVVDYKFTAEEMEKHKIQLLNYKDLIMAMGYLQVRPYLFYAQTGKLKAI